MPTPVSSFLWLHVTKDVHTARFSLMMVQIKWPTPRVAWSLAALTDCWYSQLSSTLQPSVLGVVARAVHLALEEHKKKS